MVNDSVSNKVKNLTSHGVSRILTAENKAIKTLWSLLFATAWIFCIYSIIQSISYYFDYEVITSIETVFETPFKFPAVTFCNPDPSGYLDISSDELISIKKLNDRDVTLDYALFASKVYDMFQNKSLNNIYKQAIHACFFNGRECNESDFSISHHSLYGICFEFNGHNQKGTKEISRPGILSGLIITFFFGVSKFELNNIPYSSLPSAIYLNIHDNRKKFELQPTLIPPESFSLINAVKFRTVDIPYPYSDCMKLNTIDDYNSNLYKITFKRFGYYQQRFEVFNMFLNFYLHKSFMCENCSDCLVNCQQEFIVKTCKCYYRGLDSYIRNVEPCLNKTQIECYGQVYINMPSYLDKNCTECPLECTKTSFGSTVTSTSCDFTKFYGTLTNNKYKNITLSDIQKRLSRFSVYFNDLKCTNYIQVPKMYLGQLISNIGGYLGLMVGASVLTLIEIIEVMLWILCAYFKKICATITK